MTKAERITAEACQLLKDKTLRVDTITGALGAETNALLMDALGWDDA